MRPGGKALVIAVSAALWLAAQFGLNDVAYAWFARSIHHRVPLDQNGAFDLVAWQLIWVLGLCLGTRRAMAASRKAPSSLPIGTRTAAIALAVTVGSMLWRHVIGQAPFPTLPELDVLFDKWHLGPLRMLNFLVLAISVMHFAPRLAPFARIPGLQLLGRQSLPVFCAHLVVVLIALSVLGDRAEQLSIWTQIGVLGGTLLVIGFVAGIADEKGHKDRAPQRVPVGVQMQAVRAEKLAAR
jgi:hypothetical protein